MIKALHRALDAIRRERHWHDPSPVREELFGVERIEQHAESLAAAQQVTSKPPRVQSLSRRLSHNAHVLLLAYRASAADVEAGRELVPAAEWLLDNYHLVEQQIREVRDDLPPGYYRQLPKLADGPFAGYPRVFGIAWAYVAHTDSHFDPEVLRRFLAAYQRVEPLTIGELWAVAITLRIVLIENLRRLTDQITTGRIARADAGKLAGQLLAKGRSRSALDSDISTRSAAPLSERFAAELAKQLRDLDPATTPALGWLEERLALQGTSTNDVVQRAQQRQGASNVTVRNIFTSMRLISDIDWADLFESVSLVETRLRTSGGYAAMDFATRNQYRSAIEELARGSGLSELDVTRRALDAASDGEATGRRSDPGYFLISDGRGGFEQDVGFRPPPRLRFNRFTITMGMRGYVGAILLASLLLLVLTIWALPGPLPSAMWLAAFILVALVPATEVATALVNRVVTWSFGAVVLPGLDLKDGIPTQFRTLVAVPTLLANEADILEQVERLEVHHLSSARGDATFALLSDSPDADSEVMAEDAQLLEVARAAIERLNRQHAEGPYGPRFLLLHRRRLFNPGEGRWMGWERKRGKLHELNRLLRGANDTSFMTIGGQQPRVPGNVRYVITLDADTRLPRDTTERLVGKMAHPLNRAIYDADKQRVTGGYGILQPRVTPSLPVGREGSAYQQIFSGPAGMDPYAAAVSDVYQDLFGEGSYTGKGIYDVDAFEAALAGRVPENAMLSHDLFEGIFARAGLATDIEVVEDFPARYDVAAKRQHRWTRGDWQLLPWIFGKARASTVPAIGRGKMLDNLRRSLLPLLTLLSFGLFWLLPPFASLVGSLLLLAALALPSCLSIFFAIVPRRAGIDPGSHIRMLSEDTRQALTQTLLSLAFLPDQVWRMIDAISRTLYRLFVSRKHLLEWTPAALLQASPRLDVRSFYRNMAPGSALALAMSTGAITLMPTSWPVALPFMLLWVAAPAIAQWTSRPPKARPELVLAEQERRQLRLIARQTWRYFETFVTPADSMLPPDNFQEQPNPVVAHRTSPTNIGLYLLSTVAARDFGWAGLCETVERLEATVTTLLMMPRFRGHFYNWYDTQDLRVLDPPYVSSVDSGNLAGHLIALANACDLWAGMPAVARSTRGMGDNLHLAMEAVRTSGNTTSPADLQLLQLGDEISAELQNSEAIGAASPVLSRLIEKACKIARDQNTAQPDGVMPAVQYWLETLRKLAHQLDRDHTGFGGGAVEMEIRLKAIAHQAREMALAMDFEFLMEPDRKLLSIGFSVVDNRLDSSCYDLLASEARLASLFAIAKGDAPTRHWFRLGRSATPLGSGSALISWSGSMFEYLMPSLVMRAPSGSLLDQTNKLIVARQQAYGTAQGVPWGISESAYGARDVEFTYQYSNFGVPGLGLKRGLSENLVIAPYATGLAAMVDGPAAVSNYTRLADIGARGPFGFYDAVDFTRSRVPEDQPMVIVRNYMAHHQGMTIVAVLNTLSGGSMRERFHREPMIKACELLLQEKIPRNVAAAHPQAEEVKASASGAGSDAPTVRRFSVSDNDEPITHLLSNGRYTVLLTATGGGYSRWRDVAVTRWREDTTRDNHGSYFFLQDVKSKQRWSPGALAIPEDDAVNTVTFAEDCAEFVHREGSLTTTMEVVVSGEDDGEVRRVSIANSGRRSREIEITSYAEVVLAAQSADVAHPAFAKMFVQTEYLAEFGALVATRRPRSHGEPRIWAAQFAVVEGEVISVPQYESDRAHFIGRGRTLDNAAALEDGQSLSNTVGTVLDPVFSLRQRVRIAPGKLARISYWTLVAATREALLDLIDKHHDRSAFERARTLAWTQAQVQLHYLSITAADACDFQRLAAPVIYASRRFRPSSETIARGAGTQSGLWPLSISGDLPIVVMRIDDTEDLAHLRQLLKAHEYWRMKRLAVDLVIINDRGSSYIQDLQIAIESAVRSCQPPAGSADTAGLGSIHALRADLMSNEARMLLQSSARVVLSARRGSISAQLEIFSQSRTPSPARAFPALQLQAARAARPSSVEPLEFFNGLGGFGQDGREYVTVLNPGMTTPAPWINVISNPSFGFQVSAEGSGYTWADSSRENQITQWSNDPVSDPAGEAIYVRDEATGDVWTPTAQPIRDEGSYVARHGFGYSSFSHEAHGVGLELLQYVALDEPVKISRLTLRNLSGRSRRLSVTAYVEWVLGTSRGQSAPFIVTEIDAESGAMLARNPWSTAFSGRISFADLGGRQTSWTGDRASFLGKRGSLARPAALTAPGGLSGVTGAGLDPCAALQTAFELAPGESTEVVFLLGQATSAEKVRQLVTQFRAAGLGGILEDVKRHWRGVLGAVKVETPDRAMDIMLNGWLLYQAIACRVWARSAFYQASGAYGFRDQLQDGMALSFTMPDETRRHLLRAAARQFPEGDVQHWWLPQTGQGVRTRISDDRVWLAYATATYIATSGDIGVLDEPVPFLDGPKLRHDEHDAFYQPMTSDQTASLFEHCARGLDQCLELTGANGLPLIGSGDWNDGMNRVGEAGRGESVWLAWLLLATIEKFAPFADVRDSTRATRWRQHAATVAEAIETRAWDGAWYRRATFDNGSWLGSAQSGECKIDSIAQSWAVLSGAADPQRARQAMASLERHLIRKDDGLALLFTPPFDRTESDPGYIKGYPPGLRENGGQYSHAAMWTIFAYAKLGHTGKAVELFGMLNPINHTSDESAVQRYKVEPYVVAADIYSAAAHTGRGGWTWYTGAAGWMYRAGVEGVIGLRREADALWIDPRLPDQWPQVKLTVNVGTSSWEIAIRRSGAGKSEAVAVEEGSTLAGRDGSFRLALDGRRHQLSIYVDGTTAVTPPAVPSRK